MKTSQFSGYFNNLVIASDHKGQYHYAITVGNEIRTTLTPMTFSKPKFNGIQWDVASDKYSATLLLSRISNPGTAATAPTDNTNLLGGRLEGQVGDFVRVGGTLINAHHANTKAEAFNENLFTGNLLGVQNAAAVTRIEVRLSDDSPEDARGGGALFASDILIRDLEGQETRGSEIGFRALVEGGLQRRGYLAAEGDEVILLHFDFSLPGYTGPDPSNIESVQIELVVANDYRVEVSSDRQTDTAGNPVYLQVARAAGNASDGSNQRVIAFAYGLPTANQVAGITVAVSDVAGVHAYLEANLNDQFRKYPSPRLRQHRSSSTRASAYLLNLARVWYPYFAFVEAFDVSPAYTTSMTVVSEDGQVRYGGQLQRYEFVDDNDDQDRRPDWQRQGWQAGDQEIFPGWDENNDFISDFNQNDSEVSPNRVPDYDEPFLRFHTDRPEFLYGVDMNHNGWIDRFENDTEADYPYPRDRQGYNAYAGVHLNPTVRLTVGRQRVRQKSDDRRTHAAYVLLTARREEGRWGRWLLFQDLRRVRDTIRDDLLQWLQPPNTRGDLYPVTDELTAQNTYINTTWIGLDSRPSPGLEVSHKLKWQAHWQRDPRRQLALRGTRSSSSFLGLVNRAVWQVHLGRLVLSPGWKSEWLRRTPDLRDQPVRHELNQLLMLMVRLPVLRSSYLGGGFEYNAFFQLREPTPSGAEDGFGERVTALQLTNRSEYMGYRLITLVGLAVSRRAYEVGPPQSSTRGFFTVYAAVGE
ncbi:MAG: hypothetical protein AB1505_11900 [Candidatus Latescibacterota bacterium]